MKQCPKCSRVYADETLNFCLDDSEWLALLEPSLDSAIAIISGEDLASERRIIIEENSRRVGSISQKSSPPTRTSSFTILNSLQKNAVTENPLFAIKL
jgi:hypothetical protein